MIKRVLIMKSKLANNLLIVFVFFTIVFLGLAIYNDNGSLNAVLRGIKVSANVESVDEGSRALISYIADGRTIYSHIDNKDHLLKESDKVTVYYAKNNIQDCYLKKDIQIVIIYLVIALICLFGAILSGIKVFKNSKKGKRLKYVGHRIMAQLKTIKVNEKIMVNGKHPYYIECSYKDNDTDYKFINKEIWIDNLDKIIKEKNITEIPVYIADDNYDVYYIDIDSIKE